MNRVAPSTVAAVNDAVKVKLCTGHTRPICHINYSKIVDDSFWFVSSCHDSKPMLRNGESGDWVGTFEGHKGAVYCSAFNEAATRVVTVSGDYTAVIWDALTGARLHTWEHPQYIKSCDWASDRVVTGNFDGKARIFDPNKYDADPRVIAAHEKVIKAVYFMPDDLNSLVTASEDLIYKWDLRTSEAPIIKREISGLNVLDYTHMNDFAAACGKSIIFLDSMSLLEKNRINTSEEVECASISPDGQHVAIGSKIKVKEYTMDGSELENHRGHHGSIFHIRWAPDGETFTSGAEDGTVRIWPSHAIIQKYEG